MAEQKDIICTKCNKKYKTPKTLEKHIKQMHPVEEVLDTNSLNKEVEQNIYIPNKYIIKENDDGQEKEIINYKEEFIELKKRYNYLFNCILELNHYIKNVLLVENMTDSFIKEMNDSHPGLNLTKDMLTPEILEKIKKLSIQEFNKGSFIPN